MAEADGHIFYSVSRDNGSGVWNHGIYSSNANGTNKLSNDRVTNLYAKNGWLYYYAQNGSAEEDFEDALRQSGFFIMRFDGLGRRKLGPASYKPDNRKFIQIDKNTFYYSNKGLIYRMDTDSGPRAVSIEKTNVSGSLMIIFTI